MIDIQELKLRAVGQWRSILTRLGFPEDCLSGRNVPCPKCGGSDRFRFTDMEGQGSILCNQCGRGIGDGIGAARWFLGADFPTAVKAIANELGLQLPEDGTDLVAEVAWAKSTGTEQLRDFGAYVGKRGDIPVCRVPMYDADFNKTGDFDISPRVEELAKGKMTSGSKHGMFWVEAPTEGQTVCIVEGVKDAAALWGLGIAAVGLPTCRMDATLARAFRACHCIIVPDRDKAGAEGAKETAARLQGVAASVKVAELPADFTESGGADVRDVLRTKDGEKKVRDAIRHARPWGEKKAEIKFHDFADVCLEWIEGIENQPPLMSTGIRKVDEAIGGGVASGEMVIIAGRPSHGKSVCGAQMLDAMALNGPVLFLSQEMGRKAMAERAIAAISGHARPAWKAMKERVREEIKAHYLNRYPFLFVESPGTAEVAVQAIDRAKAECGIIAVVADYVQLFRAAGNSRYEQVTLASQLFKDAATRLDIVLLALCQLNRQTEATRAQGDKMSQIRDSGQLEQDADVILFVEWLWRTSPNKRQKHEYLIKVLKNRNREIVHAYVPLHFEASRLRLTAVADAEAQDVAANNLFKDDFSGYGDPDF